MITNGSKEKYKPKTRLVGTSVTVDDIPRAAGFSWIQYNQNEFKDKSYYCPVYMCFTLYSAYTWVEIPKERRREIVQRLLDKKIIVDGKGGYLDDVVDEVRDYLTEKTNIKRVTMIVNMTGDNVQKLRDKNYVIGTWFYPTALFNKDKDDNGIVDSIDSVDDDGGTGHALGDELDGKKHMRVDNYSGINKHNVYQIIPYQEFVSNRKMHFKYGFIFTTLPDALMTQAQQDANDFQEAVDAKIVLRPENKGDKSTIEQVAIMIIRAVRYVLSKVGK